MTIIRPQPWTLATRPYTLRTQPFRQGPYIRRWRLDGHCTRTKSKRCGLGDEAASARTRSKSVSMRREGGSARQAWNRDRILRDLESGRMINEVMKGAFPPFRLQSFTRTPYMYVTLHIGRDDRPLLCAPQPKVGSDHKAPVPVLIPPSSPSTIHNPPYTLSSIDEYRIPYRHVKHLCRRY